jgi:hypothetical protein
MSTTSEQARAQAIRAGLAAAEKKQDAERVRLSWKTGEIMATVVEVPLSAVVLNPRSHRIRAQLESRTDRGVVERDPFGSEAQEIISGLLRETELYDELRNNLKDVGQTNPGVITHIGLLVNANTRCVALRDLGERYVRVAVLPEDAPEEEIDRLELRLQMQRDFHRDYTFTNELLFIDELVKKYRYKSNEIALAMNWASKSDAGSVKRAEAQVQQCLRMLTIIREVQYVSGDRLPLTAFDTNRQAIMELDEDYERLKPRDAEKAKQLRDTRLVGLLSGAGYRELREINEEFLEDYLVPSMEEQSLLQGKVDKITQALPSSQTDDVPGLDVLEPSPPESAAATRTPTAATLLILLAESAGKEQIKIPNGDGQSTALPRQSFVQELKQAVESAAEDARIDRQQGDLLDRPRTFVRKATKHLKNAIEAYRKANVNRQFDAKAFGSAVKEHTSALDTLTRLMAGEIE